MRNRAMTANGRTDGCGAPAPGRPGGPARALAAAFLALLFSISFVSAGARQSKPASELPPGVTVGARADRTAATVGDPITIDFDFGLPSGYEVDFPKLSGQAGDFTILEVYPGPSIPETSGSAPTTGEKKGAAGQAPAEPQKEGNHYRARVVAALYETGEFEFPSLEVGLRNDRGEDSTISTPPVRVRIESVLGKGRKQQLEDLKQQAEIAEPVRWPLWLGIGSLILLAALAGWWLYRRRRRPSFSFPARPEIDPLDLAESELRDLLGRGLVEKGSIKQFYVMLSDIVKRILEAGYGIQTVEKTTSEIMAELRSDPGGRGAKADSGRIEALLSGCDLVKFAKYVPTKGENDEAVDKAFRILAECRKAKAAPAEPEPAGVGG